jgi:hypothetical protein
MRCAACDRGQREPRSFFCADCDAKQRRAWINQRTAVLRGQGFSATEARLLAGQDAELCWSGEVPLPHHEVPA